MSRESKVELIRQLMDAVRASQTATDLMDDAACHALGINRTDGRCVDIIDREGPITAGKLAERAALTTAGVTIVLDRLEKAGYARRVRDERDRRRVLVEVTPLVRERSSQIWGPVEQFERELRRYSADELRLLRDFHRRGAEWNEGRAAEVRKLHSD
jgi:DNA-binding MarR family transcriptional regulator